MRRAFFRELHKQMTIDTDIIALTGDLGYGGFDQIRKDYPGRFINCGASEQAMLDMAVGIALSGKKPFVYSITNFLVYRPFETLRTYINAENVPVILCASGRDKDYAHDGISHQSGDVKSILDCLPNITQHYPMDKEEIPDLLQKLVDATTPQFISLKR